MFEYIEQLSITEAENLKRTIRDLFRQTCILQIKYDPVTLVPRDNPRYQTCLDHRKFIQDYLEVTGCELHYDSQEHIFWIAGEGVTAEKMTEVTSLLILLLKLIYRDKIMGSGLEATVTTLAELREYGRNTNLITRKLTVKEWSDALSTMKIHQIIEIPGAIGNVEDNTPIYIYGTINIYCSSVDINEIIRKYQDEVDEVVKTEEGSGETGEENIHEDAAE